MQFGYIKLANSKFIIFFRCKKHWLSLKQMNFYNKSKAQIFEGP